MSAPVTLSTGVSSKPESELTKLELWEQGRALLGYGDWEYGTSAEPYQKWSGMEAHKLFMVMRKRKITNEEFLLCCRWCQAHHKRIENAIWVFRFISEAKQEQREQAAQKPITDLSVAIADALACERSLAAADNADWIGRLSTARGPYREEVLASWKAARFPAT